MAGSFGYERGKYDVSVRCGERVLLPAVRSASKDTLIIADGFSCRGQIEQLTDRRALHLGNVAGKTVGNVPVFNVALPVLLRSEKRQFFLYKL